MSNSGCSVIGDRNHKDTLRWITQHAIFLLDHINSDYTKVWVLLRNERKYWAEKFSHIPLDSIQHVQYKLLYKIFNFQSFTVSTKMRWTFSLKRILIVPIYWDSWNIFKRFLQSLSLWFLLFHLLNNLLSRILKIQVKNWNKHKDSTMSISQNL